MLFLTILFFIVPVSIVVPALGWFIQNKEWSKKKKRWVFTLTAGFLCFPTLIPAATIVMLPVPNIAAIVLGIVFGEIFGILKLYYLTWTFALPSLLITTLVMGGIAQMMFYERKVF